MISLLTGQPGNGKTSKIINIIRAAIAEGRTVYTCGIPKLKLPVIEITRAQLMLWHERTEVLPAEKKCVAETYSPRAKLEYESAIKSTNLTVTDDFLQAYHKTDDVEPIYVLNNIAEGALIIVDEAQKGFEPSGTKIPEHISYLSEHRHHGLDFFFITQYPFLIHQTVRALVTRHWHIRYTWKGRKIHEWPEWQERPQSATALEIATTENYTIDSTTFKEYESASMHTVVKHKRPFYVYFILASFLAVPVLGYTFVNRMYEKTQIKQNEVKKEKAKNEPTFTASNNNPAPTKPVDEIPQIVKPQYESVEIVSNQYDWSQIGACVQFKNKCTCYGDAANKLIVPESVCKSAVDNGWSGRNKPTEVLPVTEPTKDNQLYPARDVDSDFTNAVGMSTRVSPNNT